MTDKPDISVEVADGAIVIEKIGQVWYARLVGAADQSTLNLPREAIGNATDEALLRLHDLRRKAAFQEVDARLKQIRQIAGKPSFWATVRSFLSVFK